MRRAGGLDEVRVAYLTKMDESRKSGALFTSPEGQSTGTAPKGIRVSPEVCLETLAFIIFPQQCLRRETCSNLSRCSSVVGVVHKMLRPRWWWSRS